MRTDYETMIGLLVEERQILMSINRLTNKWDKEKANVRLHQIDVAKQGIYPSILKCLYELSMTLTDQNVLLDTVNKTMKKKEKRKEEWIEVEIDDHELESELDFFAWLITYLITGKVVFYGDFEAELLYECIKALLNDDEPKKKRRVKIN